MFEKSWFHIYCDQLYFVCDLYQQQFRKEGLQIRNPVRPLIYIFESCCMLQEISTISPALHFVGWELEFFGALMDNSLLPTSKDLLGKFLPFFITYIGH